MRAVRRFGRFCYDFFVGDDWVAAAGVVVALGVTAAVAATRNPWWLLPVAAAAILVVTVHRGAAAARPGPERPVDAETPGGGRDGAGDGTAASGAE